MFRFETEQLDILLESDLNKAEKSVTFGGVFRLLYRDRKTDIADSSKKYIRYIS